MNTTIDVYYFGCKKNGVEYVACIDRSHASVRPIEEVLVGKRSLLLYTNKAKARQALKSRRINSLSDKGSNYVWKGDTVVAQKSDLNLISGRLTLDI